ncbi:hypothetical protein D9M70_525070 [compost metagenome]
MSKARNIIPLQDCIKPSSLSRNSGITLESLYPALATPNDSEGYIHRLKYLYMLSGHRASPYNQDIISHVIGTILRGFSEYFAA